MGLRNNLFKAITHPTISCYVEEGKKSNQIDGLVGLFRLTRPNFRSFAPDNSPRYGTFYYNWDRKSPLEWEIWRNRLTKFKEFLSTY